MPITIAHPAFAIPLWRLRRESGWLVALWTGSVTPDILQTLYGPIDRSPHSLLGLVALDTPLAVALAWFAHYTITNRLRRMPGMESIRPSTPISWIWTPVAAFLAGGIHLLVDLFSHAESPLAQTGFLAVSLGGPEWSPFLVAHLLWYVGSVVGTLAIAVWLLLRAWKVPGSWRRFLCWKWIALVTVCLLPFVPLLHFLRLIYTPDLMEFVSRFRFLAIHVRIALAASAILGWSTLYAVTMGRSTSETR